jgi:hypothetical protein
MQGPAQGRAQLLVARTGTGLCSNRVRRRGDGQGKEDAMAAHGRGMRCSRRTAWAMQEREEEDVLQGTVAAVQGSEEENARQKDARLGLREQDL